MFYNICTHIQMKYIPTVNPACNHVQTTYELLPDSACPKCLFWTEFKLYEYDTWEWGVSCGGCNSITMGVVGMNLAQFEFEWDEDILGLRRRWFSEVMRGAMLQETVLEENNSLLKGRDTNMASGVEKKLTTDVGQHMAKMENLSTETVPRVATRQRTSRKRNRGRNRATIMLESEEEWPPLGAPALTRDKSTRMVSSKNIHTKNIFKPFQEQTIAPSYTRTWSLEVMA